jgi:GWxTD domain-containing protein
MKSKIILILMSYLAATSFALEYDVDYAIFKGNEEISVVEVYLMIPRNLFKFVPDQVNYCSNALIRVALAQNDTVADIQEYQITDRVTDTLQVTGTQKIPEIATLQVKPGEYNMIVIVADLNSRQQYRFDKQIRVPNFSGNKLTCSDMQVSSQIAKTTEQNKFSKYFGYDIIPNASRIFVDNQNQLYAFLEVYNLKFDPAKTSNYKVKYSIVNLNGKEMITTNWRTKKKPGESAVEINNLNIADLSNGLYDLKAEIEDESTQQTVSLVKRFYIQRSSAQTNPAALNAETLQLEGKSEKELDEMFGPLRYLSTETEIKRYRKSDLEGKKQIILHFWDKRDSNPKTPENEDRIAYEERLQYVNIQFGTGRNAGWKTDFGRVYLIYGIPSEIERFPSALENKPYQIWHYNEVEGGVKFYFVDKSGFGTYELVHSTARNELQDVDWERWISPYSTSPEIDY